MNARQSLCNANICLFSDEMIEIIDSVPSVRRAMPGGGVPDSPISSSRLKAAAQEGEKPPAPQFVAVN